MERKSVGGVSGICFGIAGFLGIVFWVQSEIAQFATNGINDPLFSPFVRWLTFGTMLALVGVGSFFFIRDIKRVRKEGVKPKLSFSFVTVAVVAGFVILLASSIMFSLGKANEQAEAPQAEVTEGDAWTMSKQFLEEFLKAPRTAKYPIRSDPKVIVQNYENDIWALTGYVDAQNSFGALLRSPFTCHMRYNGGENWSLLYMSLDGKVMYDKTGSVP